MIAPQLLSVILATGLTLGGLPDTQLYQEREKNYHDTCQHEPCKPWKEHKPTPPPQSPPAPVPQSPSVPPPVPAPEPAPSPAPGEQPAPLPVPTPSPVVVPQPEAETVEPVSWGK